MGIYQGKCISSFHSFINSSLNKVIKTVPKNTQTGKERKTFVVIKQQRTIWSTHFQRRSHYTEIEREKKTKTKSRAEYISSKICYGGEDVKTDVTSQFFFLIFLMNFIQKIFSAKDSTMIFPLLQCFSFFLFTSNAVVISIIYALFYIQIGRFFRILYFSARHTVEKWTFFQTVHTN